MDWFLYDIDLRRERVKEGLAMLAQSLSNFAPQQIAHPPPIYYN